MNQSLNDLLMHPSTKFMLESFIKKPSHALLIVGGRGSGKRTAAKAVASQLLGVTLSALDSYPYFTHILKSPGDKEIPVESIRSLNKSLRLRTTGGGSIRRAVLIEGADDMTLEAQNSMLKMLEEPSADTVFIITAPSERSMVSTITSRAQIVTVNPIGLEEAREFYSSDIPAEPLEKAWQLSQGYTGLLTALLNNKEPHPLKEAVDTAKTLLRQSPYERVILLDGISKDKSELVLLLDALNRVITSLHHASVKAGNTSQQKKLLDCRKLIQKLLSDLSANANPRLVILRLAMNLSV